MVIGDMPPPLSWLGVEGPRGPFCMMGVCFDCLVEIDGVPNVQGCMTPVREGMQVRAIQGKARLG